MREMLSNLVCMQSSEFSKMIETRLIKVYLRNDGIIETVMNNVEQAGEFTLADAKETVKAVKDISEGELLPMLSELPSLKIKEEIREYYSKTEPAVSASALLSTGFMQGMLGYLFLKVNRLPVPTRVFNDRAEALEWLRSKVSK